MDLIEIIQKILKTESGLKAREIATRMAKQYNKTVSKSEINAMLYGYENIHFKMSKDFRWSLLYGNEDP